MKKLLFFDNHAVQSIDGMKRVLNKPFKCAANPLFTADRPWENGTITTYGTVMKTPGRPYQAWYTVISPAWRFYLAYAESNDGLSWTKPQLDICELDGFKTNIVLDVDVHGPAIIYDEREPREDWRYKMLCGAKPGDSVCAFHSADGIHWAQAGRFPVILSGPDCPMGLLRMPDGRYAAYHRVWGNGRRVFRSDSWDFLNYSEPRLVMEPDAGDPPLIQFYGLGSSPYGNYEIGTLWMYHVDASDPSTIKGYQETELAYARSGYAWHRAMQGDAFLPHGGMGTWEQGNLQASSAPVYLEDEIRYYYAATTAFHSRRWEIGPQRSGLGMASIRPDRFVGLSAGGKPGTLVTMPFTPSPGALYVNADIKPGGRVRVAVLADAGEPLQGYSLNDCVPVEADTLGATLHWRGADFAGLPRGNRMRLCLEVKDATLYSVFIRDDCDRSRYHEFEAW